MNLWRKALLVVRFDCVLDKLAEGAAAVFFANPKCRDVFYFFHKPYSLSIPNLRAAR